MDKEKEVKVKKGLLSKMKGLLSKIIDKLDKKLEKKSKQQPCCCGNKNKNKNGENSCC